MGLVAAHGALHGRAVVEPAHAARVGEVALAPQGVHARGHLLRHAVFQCKAVGVGKAAEDAHQLGRGVVVEGHAQAKAVAQAWVRAEELLYLVGVAGDDAHEPVALGLEHLHERVDGLLAVAASREQGVRLVDEEHASQGALHHPPRAHGRLAQVGGEQVGGTRGHEGARAVRHAQGVEVGREAACQLRLARAGVSGEGHVHALDGAAPVLRHHRAHLAQHLLLALETDEPREGVGAGCVEVLARLEVGGLGARGLGVLVGDLHEGAQGDRPHGLRVDAPVFAQLIRADVLDEGLRVGRAAHRHVPHAHPGEERQAVRAVGPLHRLHALHVYPACLEQVHIACHQLPVGLLANIEHPCVELLHACAHARLLVLCVCWNQDKSACATSRPTGEDWGRVWCSVGMEAPPANAGGPHLG